MDSAEVSVPQLMFGDCLDRLKELPADSVSAVVTDPPYGMEFMGKEWDSFKTKDGFRRSRNANDAGRDNAFGRLSQKGPEYYAGAFQEYMTPIFAECLRVLKPGGHLLAFGGSRTYHRLASAVEDAGFEIRDQIMWLYGCLSDDTQCLTRLGWKPYTELTTADEVLQWNPQTEELSWVHPDAIHVYPYSGDLLRLKNRHTDQLLTPNHRVYTKVRRHSRNPAPQAYSAMQACELRPHWHLDLPVAGFLKSGRRVTRAYLVGWWLTDAWKHADGKAAMFSQSKPRTLLKLRAALGPFSPSEYTRPAQNTNHHQEHTFYVKGELAEYLLREFPERELTWDVLSWDQESRLALLEGLLDGDGSVPAGQNSMTFWSKKAARLDVFQALCLSLGYRSYIDFRKGCVFLNRTTTTQTQSIHRQDPVHYVGNVWCLTVPTGAFVVRRNGRAFITGNSGFPKSLDVSKAIDATTLYGGSDTSRIKEVNKSRPGEGRARSTTNNDGIMGDVRGPKITKDVPATPEAAMWKGWGTALKPAHEPIVLARKPLIGTVAANVLQHGTGGINIDDCRVERASDDRFEYGVDGDEQPTTGASGIYGKFAAVTPYDPHPQGRWPANVIHDGSEEVLDAFGTTARYFYCAKANKKDRGEGNNHPTVKPTELMRYLIRLVTPPHGVVLDPFMGSGSTGKAAALEGFHFVGIEKDRAYFDIAKQRVENEYALAV
jgi:site-specific DNA-methyltransferase (adenine-specific)